MIDIRVLKRATTKNKKSSNNILKKLIIYFFVFCGLITFCFSSISSYERANKITDDLVNKQADDLLKYSKSSRDFNDALGWGLMNDVGEGRIKPGTPEWESALKGSAEKIMGQEHGVPYYDR